jgi:hypothetical protein
VTKAPFTRTIPEKINSSQARLDAIPLAANILLSLFKKILAICADYYKVKGRK